MGATRGQRGYRLADWGCGACEWVEIDQVEGTRKWAAEKKTTHLDFSYILISFYISENTEHQIAN